MVEPKVGALVAAVLMSLLSGCASEQSTAGYTIPEEFRGYWEHECYTGDETDGVRIERDRFVQYEGAGQVRLVRRIGPKAIGFSALMIHGDVHWPLQVEAKLVRPDVLRLTIDVDEFELNELDLDRCGPSPYGRG
jgi:hypothetical protein